MNRRIKKKLNNRLGCKSYSKYKDKLIDRVCSKYAKRNNLDPSSTMFLVVKSKTGKKVLNMSVFTNIVPTSCGLIIDEENKKDITLEFKASNPGDSLSDENKAKLEEVVEKIRKMHKANEHKLKDMPRFVPVGRSTWL